MSTDKEYNEGAYSNPNTASDWILWVESITSSDVRYTDIYPYLSGWVQENNPSTILEIGSGQGECSEKVNLQNADYIGIEPSKYLRDRAHMLYGTKTFLAGKAEQLPLPDDAVDAAFSVFVWFHIADLKKAAEELSRVLKLGGVFTIVTANPAIYDLWLSWHHDAVLEGKKLTGNMGKLSGDVMYLHSFDEMKDSLLENGLTIVKITECGYEDERKTGRGFTIIISGKK